MRKTLPAALAVLLLCPAAAPAGPRAWRGRLAAGANTTRLWVETEMG